MRNSDDNQCLKSTGPFEALVQSNARSILNDGSEIATPPTMITFTRTTADRILQLRHRVLRPGLPIAEVIFPEDQDQETQHYGALNQQGEVICCVTLISSTWHGEPAWRLRTMATASDWRNQGMGTGLIRYWANLVEHQFSSQCQHLSWIGLLQTVESGCCCKK
ncbi:hypothetical protein [Acaryochloris sp. IP29b_bin.148]|uniref:hypothetical protein n=1 Tax=Acaryochloris sp. IP29b_bin.148 TaxID=2969218 RepID=UPI002611EF32|nr:hypothetical protein [Acaryochloris sp. IP29b_bin.148]